jgi:hypothetical protein
MTVNVVRWIQDRFTKGGEGDALEYMHLKYPYYNAQMQMTMEVFGESSTYFGFKNKNTTDYGLEDKAGGERVGLYIPRDEVVVANILEKYAYVSRHVKDGKPPPFRGKVSCPLDGSTQCGWCPFYYQCYGAMKAGGKVVYPGADN